MDRTHPPFEKTNHHARLKWWRRLMEHRGVDLIHLELSHEEMHAWAEAFEEEELGLRE